ncbi:sigma-70 family RNA polymerase sigma factor [Sciscionella marina]|uniref:sigma-70 family RNA polymerase sigma factor n=1 Tax=Sciscionella marina TaxID=508770 RepID=UPI0003616981|nr:sigma-70 family RNA polymerase sigma factor [Sciscionella marina]
MTDQDSLAATFETHRCYLHSIASRVLGSHADADDAVQEAWLRLARTGEQDIHELRGWLTTVIGRICLDFLRRRSTHGEQPLELKMSTAVSDDNPDPETEAVLADSVGLALHVVMDALTPAERIAFVLHDVFELPFDTIAAILARSTAATKMLASRARGRIRLSAPSTRSADRSIVDAFLTAASKGDIASLLTLLAPEVELHTDTQVIRGARTIATRASFGARSTATGHPALINGAPGILLVTDGRPSRLMAFTVDNGRITTIRILSDPQQLAQLVPSWIT